MKKNLLQLNALSEAIHTGLRKACSSYQSSAAWNMLHMTAFDDAWSKYVLNVIAITKGGYILRYALEAAIHQMSDYDNATLALRGVFEMLTQEELDSLAEFVEA